jgi:hypothetical protein
MFSDSYIGSGNATSRKEPGLSMIANSLAIETCAPDGKAHVRYYWNYMNTKTPQPLFRTFTPRYKFWVNGAFKTNSCLYVVLQKIGPKRAPDPKDLFSFSELGYTLAKINDPENDPFSWNIKLMPLPAFSSPLSNITSAVQTGDHVYFFLNRNDKAQHLVRKKIDFLDDPEKPFEYFALNKSWKTGFELNDMDTVIHGFRSTTVTYHPELRKWLMVCDIEFMQTQIKVRTATELTGPWSEEKTIYEIPELDPASTSYTKGNFCYSPRECPPYYNRENEEVLFTYDINNSDPANIMSKPEIYTPKTITVSLKQIALH